MAAGTYSQWDFRNKHVESNVNLGWNYASAESSLIAAGPPIITGIPGATAADIGSGITLYPCGVIDNAALQQGKQLQRIFEIGSARSYFIPGRTLISFSVGRVFYHGDSLMKALYRGTTTTDADGRVTISSGLGANQTRESRFTPGADGFWMNLASDAFNMPHGEGWYFKDNMGDNIGAFYLESCYCQGHQLSLSAGSVLIMEGASFQADRMVPIKIADTQQLGDVGELGEAT